MANVLQKLIFRWDIFVTIADANIGIIKFLRTLFDKYSELMLMKFEQNRMVQTIINFVLFDKKWLTIF